VTGINKVLPVIWVPPTELWDIDRLQIGAEPSDNRHLKDCCGVNHSFYNRIPGATVGLHWHGPSNVEGPRHALGTSVYYREPQLQVRHVNTAGPGSVMQVNKLHGQDGTFLISTSDGGHDPTFQLKPPVNDRQKSRSGLRLFRMG
jgi:hypothetical protein